MHLINNIYVKIEVKCWTDLSLFFIQIAFYLYYTHLFDCYIFWIKNLKKNIN